MKKDKIIMASVIGGICIILFTIIFAQYRVIEQTDLTGIKAAREEELQTMLSSMKTKYEEMEEKLLDTQDKISEYEKIIDSSDKTSELIEKELEQTNMLVGKTNVVGEGVIITMKDNNNKSIEPSDLRTLVNELKLAGAEAISINDKRILNMSEIVEAGGYILIDEDRVSAPYTIKAIGDQTYLSSALSLKNSGFIDTYKKVGKTVEMKTDKKISISAYNSKKNQLTLKYAKGVEE